MRITKISLQGFRAFDEPFVLDLDGGKNLLLHGENGSGKSSIYFALKRFFEERGDDVTKYRNHFSKARRRSHVKVHIKGEDAAGVEHDNEFWWDEPDGHPLPVPKDPATAPIPQALRSMLVDAGRRAGFLDYRMMLRSSLLSGPLPRTSNAPACHNVIYGTEAKGLEAQLFDLVSMVVLAGVRVAVSGGSESTIGELVRRVWEKRPVGAKKAALREAILAANTFNQAFNAKLPELETKLAELLRHFDNHHLSIKFQPVSLSWNKSLELSGAELHPQIAFRGKTLANHHEFLNEARLSAISTCMFFAGVLLSDTDPANEHYPRFLVLDDALIGLDLQNRLPILKILQGDAFKHFQKFLFTHDRVWFDLARGHLRETDGWLHRELLADEARGRLVPREKASQTDLVRAQTHLDNGDLVAAAVYARAAFEWKLRNVGEKRGIEVKFKKDTRDISADDLWQKFVLRQRSREQATPRQRDFIPQQLERDVEVVRSTVLNQLSHAGAPGLVTAEVQFAIDTMTRLHAHDFPNVT